jgi:hypothetical protein
MGVRDFLKMGEKKIGGLAGQLWVTLDNEEALMLRLIELRSRKEPLPPREGAIRFNDAEELFFAMDPSHDGDKEAAWAFWSSVAGSHLARGDFLVYEDLPGVLVSQAFLEGFCEVVEKEYRRSRP